MAGQAGREGEAGQADGKAGEHDVQVLGESCCRPAEDVDAGIPRRRHALLSRAYGEMSADYSTRGSTSFRIHEIAVCTYRGEGGGSLAWMLVAIGPVSRWPCMVVVELLRCVHCTQCKL